MISFIHQITATYTCTKQYNFVNYYNIVHSQSNN